MKHILFRTDSSKGAFNIISSYAVQFYMLHSTEKQNLIKIIQNFETDHKINFIRMLKKHHNFFKDLLFKPVVNQILYYSNIPSLVILLDGQKKN